MVTGVNWSHPLNRGLLAWWPAAATQWRGAAWVDLVGRNPARLTGEPTGRNNYGRSLGCSAPTHGAIPADSPRYGVDAWTLTAWVYPTSLSTFHTVFRRGDTYDLQRHIAVWLTPTGVYVASRGGGTAVTTTPAPATNRWQQIAVSCTGTGSVSVQLDGLLAGTGSLAPSTSYSGVLSIGTSTASAGTYAFSGSISDVFLSGRAMVAAEISSLYRESLAGYPGMLIRSRPRRIATSSAKRPAILVMP